MHVINIITKLSVGGAQETVLRTCARLDPAVFTCTILTGCDPSPEGDQRARAAELGIDVVELSRLHRHVNPLADVAAVTEVAKYLRRAKPDVVHTHSSKAGIIGRLAARIAGVPAVVHTVHGWSFDRHLRRPVRSSVIMTERVAARWTNAFVVVTTRDRELGLEAAIGDLGRYHLIRSGFDVGAVRAKASEAGRAEARLTLGVDAGCFVIGSVMRLSPQKDPVSLVRAAAELIGQRPDVRLVLVGDGPLRPDVERVIEELGLGDRVRLVGTVPDATELLPAFDLMAVSSRWEGLPRVVVEAMAAGVPVVSTAVGGIDEVVQDGVTGFLVPPNDNRALAAALRRAVSEEALRDRIRTAASGVIASFDERLMAAQMGELYTDLVTAARPGGA